MGSEPFWAWLCSVLDPQDSIKELLNCVLAPPWSAEVSFGLSLFPQKSITPRRYLITSVARKRIDGGTVTPSALAVLRLTVRSNSVGCCTGISAGFAPFRIMSA